MKTVGLIFKDAKKAVKVEKPVENTGNAPKKTIKKAPVEIEPEGDE